MKTFLSLLLCLALLAIHSPNSAFAGREKSQVSQSEVAKAAIERTLKRHKLGDRALIAATISTLKSSQRGRRTVVRCSIDVIATPISKSPTTRNRSTKAFKVTGKATITATGRDRATAKRACAAAVANNVANYRLAPALKR